MYKQQMLGDVTVQNYLSLLRWVQIILQIKDIPQQYRAFVWNSQEQAAPLPFVTWGTRSWSIPNFERNLENPNFSKLLEDGEGTQEISFVWLLFICCFWNFWNYFWSFLRMERELNKLHLYNFCFFVIFEILFSFSFFFCKF